MKQKAQVQSQVFIYILALVGMAIFLIYAYRFILSYQENLYSSELVKFMKDFTFYIDELASSYMTIKTVEFHNYPRNYKKICFLDLYNLSLHPSHIPEEYPIVKYLLQRRLQFSGDPEEEIINVFLVNDIEEFGFYVKNMRVDGAFRCFNLTGKSLRIKLEGIGRKALLKEP